MPKKSPKKTKTVKRVQKCTNCHKRGHNSRTCAVKS